MVGKTLAAEHLVLRIWYVMQEGSLSKRLVTCNSAYYRRSPELGSRIHSWAVMGGKECRQCNDAFENLAGETDEPQSKPAGRAPDSTHLRKAIAFSGLSVELMDDEDECIQSSTPPKSEGSHAG